MTDDKKDYNLEPNNKDESDFLNDIINDQNKAESSRTNIETTWEDEYLMYVGDQWSTSFAYRSPDVKQIRPNSVDNFIMPALVNMQSALTSTIPAATFEARSPDDVEIAKKVGPVVEFVKYKNKFPSIWKKKVLQFLSYGPIIGAVLWDSAWMGGAGPNRWIGDVRILRIKMKEFFPDPAIIDLEDRLQDCSFIHRKLRCKLDYFRSQWPDKGKYVEADEDTEDDEGMDANQATLIERWHRGKPKFVSEEWKKYFEQKAQEYAETDQFKAEMCESMSKGEAEGVHVAYATSQVFLEYIPYVYQDGLYPFVFKVLYEDEKSPWGFGEVRNTKVPQVLHNKADEIEIEAMSREGLGGYWYSKGALSPKQLNDYKNHSSKGGVALEANDVNGLKSREGARIPAAVTNYKEHKQRMIETISQNTPIQQGMKPGGVTAFSAIKELGDRADTRTRGKVEILEDYLIELHQLILSRIAEFYTEEREFRITGDNGDQVRGAFSNREMVRTWEREPGKFEEYIPEMDVKIKLVDERPTSREYYTNMAIQMYPAGLIDLESFWFTMDEGKFPPKEDILQRLRGNGVPEVLTGGNPNGGAYTPPSMGNPSGAQFPQNLFKPQGNNQAQPPPQGPQGQDMLMAVLSQLSPEELQALQSLPPEKQVEVIQMIMGGMANG